MNIGFLYGQDIHKAGTGGTVHGFQLCSNLAKLGHGLYTWHWTDPNSDLVKHFRCREVFKFLKKIDVLYIRLEWSGFSAQYSFLRYLTAKNIPVIWEINGLPDEKIYHGFDDSEIVKIKRRLRRYARAVDATVCVSSGIAKFSNENLGINKNWIIPNGSDPEVFRPGKENDVYGGPLIVAWVGTTKAGWHNLGTLIESAEILLKKNKNIIFWIFGDSNNLPSDLPENIVIKGLYPYGKLSDELSKAHVGLHIYKHNISFSLDSSPLKQFDYMACGLALVSQPHGQRKELLENWNAGVPCEDNPNSLAEILDKLDHDRELVRSLGENGRRAVIEYFNWQRVAKQTTELFEELKKN